MTRFSKLPVRQRTEYLSKNRNYLFSKLPVRQRTLL
ncbi:conserved hypothetical protein [Nitrosomonas nitrosa]|uniref:Uncharacterized protein n=1 Tax=Nitrosomonas nitrosa TaxID=52442 RepID=A0A8H8Z127_9PROT|nr:conserved hypothetical protein [Nitrosomonas nitrosa]